ncbi:MAG: hypothetical protein PHD02_04320 [Bacilli bacterium]|nr:hypothetical protein [Bacilli bacterium]
MGRREEKLYLTPLEIYRLVKETDASARLHPENSIVSDLESRVRGFDETIDINILPSIFRIVALRLNGLLLSKLKSVNDDEIKAALEQNGLAIYYVEKPTVEMQIMAVTQNPLAILAIKNPCERAIEVAVATYGVLIKTISNPANPAIRIAIDNMAVRSITKYFPNYDKDSEDFCEYADRNLGKQILEKYALIQTVALKTDTKPLVSSELTQMVENYNDVYNVYVGIATAYVLDNSQNTEYDTELAFLRNRYYSTLGITPEEEQKRFEKK